jgi:aldehyde dehydrogenase (NAD+)
MTSTLVSTIGGRRAQAGPAGAISSANPSRLADVVAEVVLADAATFAAACAQAKAAQPAWADVPAPVRGRTAGAIGRIVDANMQALARPVTRELGKPYTEALGEVQEIIDTCGFFLGEGRRLCGQTIPSEMPDEQCSRPGTSRSRCRRGISSRRWWPATRLSGSRPNTPPPRPWRCSS